LAVRLTHPDRVLFPVQGLTKADLAAYYEAVAQRMLPLASLRPLNLVRCPQGQGKACFFQRHHARGFPKPMRRIAIREAGGEVRDYAYLSDLDGLIAGVQMGVLEFHIWGASVHDTEKADRILFDLDPDAGLGFAEVRQAAFDLRDRLEGLGLRSFPLVTGGKGVHVVAPLSPPADWESVRAFAHGFADRLAGEEPRRFTADLPMAAREGRIFIDYLRNGRGATGVAPYSTRAKERAPVAAPLSWEELRETAAANAITVPAMLARVRSEPDPWKGYGAVVQALPPG